MVKPITCQQVLVQLIFDSISQTGSLLYLEQKLVLESVATGWPGGRRVLGEGD